MKLWIILLLAFLLLDLIFVVWIFIVKKRKKKKLSSQSQKYLQKHWIRIEKLFMDSDFKHAVLDADKLLDFALKEWGYQGNLGQKLKIAKLRFSNLNGVWSAHKLRNRIAHEIIELRKAETKVALKNFKGALKDLGADL